MTQENVAHKLIQNGDYDEAINILLKLASNKKDSNISCLLGEAYQHKEIYNLAEKYYNDAILMKPWKNLTLPWKKL
jgi:tetratricopeptide (TPR) repeat protein|tara:strand:- start:2 stop:229 length:228 start_codon:yes stop_codon:yes gene_type:complete